MYSQSAHLTVQDSTFSNNTSGVEGGAFVYSPDGGLLKIQRSTFTKNTAIRKGGGALWLNDRSGIVATISGSTFNGNVAGHEGGAIGTGDDGNDTKLTIENSTISGNTAMNRDGGGIFVAGGTLTLRNDTINLNMASNGEGGGVYSRGGVTNINNTIIEGNKDKTGANDISFGESSGSATYNVQYSLIQVVPPHTINGINSHNIFGFSAGLGPLQFNGGPTMTCAITTTSKAYRAGSVQLAAGLTTDQRGPGYARVVQGFIDIGAFEIQFEVPRRHW